MNEPQEAPTFLSLPAELRGQIYAKVLTSLAHGPEILRTCRQIEREARKFLYQRPINLPNQSSLYAWLDATPGTLLSQVRDISVAVQDVDLRPILHSHTSMRPSSITPRLLTCDLYEAEVSRFVLALKRLPHLKTITIQISSNSQSHLYEGFVCRILMELESMAPDVRVLQAVS